MIVSACRPYFAPFPGFFLRALHSDTLVIMDRVQFPTGTTWLTRNRFKNDQGTLWMSIPVWRKGLGLQKIDEVRICHEGRWAKKHMAALKSAYAKAPFFEDHLPFLEEIFSAGFERLIDLNLKIIHYILRCLRISTRVEVLSDLHVEVAEPLLSVEVCRKLGATRFLTQGGTTFLDPEAFERAGIRLKPLSYRPPVYPQLWGRFIPNLSALDLLFNCGPRARRILSGKGFSS